jgi:anaerobic magnesium-protoporphyrin IX monomethyl ester cyclase
MASKKNLKVALISLQQDAERVPPIGLVYLATYLRDRVGLTENNVRILDKNYTDIEKELKRFSPDIIGFTSLTVDYGKVIRFAKQIKQIFDVPLIIGGVHISTLPQSLDKIFDIGVIGEGEETISEIIDLYLTKARFFGSDLKKIKGLVFWDDEQIILTPAREPIECDTLPIPDFAFVNKNYFKEAEIPAINSVGIKAYLISARGCPYRCPFCSTSHFWGKMRSHSPDFIARTVQKFIADFNSDYLVVLDDLFAVNPQRLREIKSAFNKYGILDKIKATECTARTNLIDDKLCEALKELKVKTLNFGFESGSDQILKYLKQDSVDVETNKRAILLCQKHGFNIYGSLMYGSPGETIEDFKKTDKFIDFAIEHGAKHIWSFVATPFPATPFWDVALQKKTVGNNMDWNLLSLHNVDNPLLLDDTVNKEEFKKIFFEGRKKLRKLKIKMIKQFLRQNPTVFLKMILTEPGYYTTKVIKQLFKQ